MKNYKARDKKLYKKKHRMPKHGRSLLNVIEAVTLKKSIQAKEILNSKNENLSSKQLISKKSPNK